MSSVEDSDREQDSLTQEQQVVLRNNRMPRGRSNSRGSKNVDSQATLYSDAFRQYLFGNFDIASQACKKLIANNPENPNPYFLMATMYKEAAKKNNDEAQQYKSVQYFFFHAYYSVPCVEKWIQVADMSYKLELYQQAAYCYGRALKMNKTNLQISLKRAECLQLCLQIKKAANIYKRIIQKISSSAQIYKKYAKLRFRRDQYSKSREILLSYPYYKQDLNIKFMIAETYLKERKFLQLYQFIKINIIDESDPPIKNIQQLQLQFIQMLFICCVNCFNQIEGQLRIDDMLELLKRQYQEQQSNLYQQIVFYIKKQNPEVTYELLKFLLPHQPHQTIQNYLYCSEFLVKQNRYNQAIKVLQDGISKQKNKNSVQLKTQLSFLKITYKTKRNQKNFKGNHYPNTKNSIQEIFYSDQQQLQKKQEQNSQNQRYNHNYQYKQLKNQQQDQFFQEQLSPVIKNKKKKKITKKNKTQQINRIQIKDPQTLSKLIQNNQLTLNTLKKEIQNTKENQQNMLQPTIYRTMSDVKQCLNYLIEIQSIREKSAQQSFQLGRSQSIFNSRQPKKRRMIAGHLSRRHNLISKNSGNLLQSVKNIIYFMKQYLRINKFSQVIEFAQHLSKAHFFKWQNRIMQFKVLKKQVYELGLLACLQLKKYGKSIFFLRYLISKNPLSQLYLGIAQRIMRESKEGKLFINKLIKKGIYNVTNQLQKQEEIEANSKEYVKLYYLTGIQYMDNCFFQLALNMFSKVASILEQNQDIYQNEDERYMCKSTYICMCTCFLQMASSRTVFNKLDYVNRSAFCLAKYKSFDIQNQFNQESVYNQGRWYCYVKIYPKAIQLFEQVLEKGENNQIKIQSALNLIIIYKDLDLYEKANQLSREFFTQN